MGNLFLNEWLKLRKSKSVKITLAVGLVYSALIAVFPGSDDSIQRFGFCAPFMLFINYASLGFWGNAAIVSGQMAGEFETGTIHNTLICGMGRGKYFAVKVISLFGVTTFIYFCGTCCLCLCKNLLFPYDPEGMIYSDYWAKLLVFQLGAVIVIFTYVAVSIFFCCFFRKAVAAFIAVAATTVLETILYAKLTYPDISYIGGPVNAVRQMATMITNNQYSEDILSEKFMLLMLPCICVSTAAVGGAYYLFRKADIN